MYILRAIVFILSGLNFGMSPRQNIELLYKKVQNKLRLSQK